MLNQMAGVGVEVGIDDSDGGRMATEMVIRW